MVFLLNLLKVSQSKIHRLYHSFFSAELLLVLRKFGKCNIKWPKNDGTNHNMPGWICFLFFLISYIIIFVIIGFCHVVFRESRSVCELLKHCTRQQRSTIDYFLHIHMTTSSPSTGLPMHTNQLKPVILSNHFSFLTISK